ncbi:MAG: tetratricopeptide repeat protein [Planctomycetota bacterium]
MYQRSHSTTANRSPAAAYQAGLAAFETGRYDEAIGLLEPIASERGLASTLARFYLGQAHLKLGVDQLNGTEYGAAAKSFLAAREINPDSTDLSRYLARCHAALRQFDLVANELERDQAAGRADDALPIRLAHAFARDHQIHRALETLETAIRSQPARADLHYHLGVLHASTDDFASGLPCLVTAAQLDPSNVSIVRNLALAYGALGRMPEAAMTLATAQQLAPHDANVAWLFARAVEAVRAVDASIDLTPAPARAAPVNDQALAQLGEIIIAEPDFVEAFLSLPASEVDHELFAMLAATLRRALENHPDYADLHFHCARVYERLGRPEAAIEEARDAIRINPSYVQALIVLGRLYGAKHQSSEAINRLEAAIEAGGDYPDVHCMLGELYRNQGKRIEAGAAYRRALELNADYSAAQRGLEAVAVA